MTIPLSDQQAIEILNRAEQGGGVYTYLEQALAANGWTFTGKWMKAEKRCPALDPNAESDPPDDDWNRCNLETGHDPPHEGNLSYWRDT